MEDYKTMYLHLFNRVSDAMIRYNKLRKLKKA